MAKAKIRIQPLDIEVPQNDPFKNDLLGRQEMVKSLTQLVGSIEGSCVLAVDAPWGGGKTTFLNIWSNFLINQKFNVVKFNAWETDFSEDPFMALCTELMKILEKGEIISSEIKKSFREKAQQVLKHFALYAAQKAIIQHPLLQELLSGLMKQTEKTHTEERLEEFREAQKAIEEFKNELQTVVCILNESKEYRPPLIVMIDELDRCRPTYAIELLETAKHLFSVDQIVFVLAINREQLAHAIKALYGEEFDAEVYLRRFFDLDFRLPEPSRDKFIISLLNSMKINDKNSRPFLEKFFDASELSLRDIAQATHRLGLVLNSMPSKSQANGRRVTVLLVLRTLNENLYRQFFREEESDEGVAEQIFGTTSMRPLQWTKEGFLFQAGLILASEEFLQSREQIKNATAPKGKVEEYISSDDEIHTTALKGKVEEYINGESNKTRHKLLEVRENARRVLQDSTMNGKEFREAYQCIELFSLAVP